MIDQIVSHYKILEKLGEVRLVPQGGTDETSAQFIFEGGTLA